MLEVKNITKKYGDKYALKEVTLTLSEGIYGLLGPNGAGKSTLMNIITANLELSGGEVLWNKESIYRLKDKYRCLLGYAPQQQGLYDTFSGKRFLSYMATLKGILKQDMAVEIERVSAYVNLTESIDMPIHSYSGGMKQRLLIAQALLGDPKMIVMDEPTAGLDPKERVRIRNIIHETAKGKIVLMATHVVSDIQTIAKEIIILKHGEIVAQNTVEALCAHFCVNDLEEVYMKLFGEEEANVSFDRI